MIHPTAIVHPNAELAADVTVGPYAIIAAGVRLGPGCEVGGHAQLLGSITLGENCRVHGAAILGGDPQDLGFDPATPSSVEIGPNNTFREHVTIHRGSKEGNVTRIGAGNYFMAGSHAGHDSQIGDRNILANEVMLGGWVVMGDGSFLGGGVGVHQFARIGDLCMVGGHASISTDLPPYTMSAGLNRIRGLNSVGMRRAGFDADTRLEIKRAFNLVYRGGKTISEAVDAASSCSWRPETERFFEFLRAPSKKGICRYREGD